MHLLNKYCYSQQYENIWWRDCVSSTQAQLEQRKAARAEWQWHLHRRPIHTSLFHNSPQRWRELFSSLFGLNKDSTGRFTQATQTACGPTPARGFHYSVSCLTLVAHSAGLPSCHLRLPRLPPPPAGPPAGPQPSAFLAPPSAFPAPPQG